MRSLNLSAAKPTGNGQLGDHLTAPGMRPDSQGDARPDGMPPRAMLATGRKKMAPAAGAGLRF